MRIKLILRLALLTVPEFRFEVFDGLRASVTLTFRILLMRNDRHCEEIAFAAANRQMSVLSSKQTNSIITVTQLASHYCAFVFFKKSGSGNLMMPRSVVSACSNGCFTVGLAGAGGVTFGLIDLATIRAASARVAAV